MRNNADFQDGGPSRVQRRALAVIPAPGGGGVCGGRRIRLYTEFETSLSCLKSCPRQLPPTHRILEHEPTTRLCSTARM